MASLSHLASIDAPDRGPGEPFGAGPERVRTGLPWLGTSAGILLTIALRLRMFWTPITSDEGGFIAIARAWSHGNVLYRDVWVDRPQGLLVVYRLWDWLSGGSTASVRIMAMVFGAALVVSVASVATTLAGRTAGSVAALLVGVTAAAPTIEGHVANGELLSGAIAVAGLAVGCRALFGGGHPRLLILSGVLGGLALSVKQSGYEGLLALLMWLAVAVVFRWLPPRRAAVAAVRLVAGAAAVISVLAIHGALTGFSRWWYAFAGYRLGGRSAVSGANWHRFGLTEAIARQIVGPLVVVCVLTLVVVGIQHATRRRPPSPEGTGGDVGGGRTALVALWSFAAVAAFATGGQFHRHYWVTLCPAFSAAAAVALARWGRPRIAHVAAFVLLIPSLAASVRVLELGRAEASLASSADPRLLADSKLAAWFDSVRATGDQMYVMCASAAFYALADEDPPFPYLWLDGVTTVPGALDRLRSLLSSPAGPRFVAIYQSPRGCDPTGQVQQILDKDYARYATVAGLTVLARVDTGAG